MRDAHQALGFLPVALAQSLRRHVTHVVKAKIAPRFASGFHRRELSDDAVVASGQIDCEVGNAEFAVPERLLDLESRL